MKKKLIIRLAFMAVLITMEREDMNIAFIIGNSEYEKLNKLDACNNDVKAINDVLSATEKYNKIFRISNKKSSELKKSITSQIKQLRKENITVDELVFYYTGHGCYKDEQFYFLPTDYDSKRHSSTSLSNEELDELLKSLYNELVCQHKKSRGLRCKTYTA